MTMRCAILSLTLLAGCQSAGSGKSRPVDPDPLYGGIATPVSATPLGGNPAAAPANVGTLGTPTSLNQPLATPSPGSTAVLATGSYPPLSRGQDLRIGTPPAAGGNRVLPRSQTPNGVLAVVTADPDYGKPRDPVPGVTALDDAGQRPATVPVSSGVGGLEQALATVNGFNPKWHKLENSGAGIWRFSCSIPDRQEPTKSRTYEAEGTTGLAAVQNVLDHINRDRQ